MSSDADNPVQAEQPRPRGLAGAHLEQALDALGAAGDPARLYPPWARRQAPTNDVGRAMATLIANRQYHTHLRTAVLFAALAAEAYVNEFLVTMLSGADFHAVDRLSPVEKYVVGCRLAVDEPMFERGAEPVQTIRVLVRLRDKLVHPKPGYGPPHSFADTTPGETEVDFTPGRAAVSIIQVASAAVTLLKRARPDDLMDMPATFIWMAQKTVLAYAGRVMAALPPVDAPAEDPLLSQLVTAYVNPSDT